MSNFQGVQGGVGYNDPSLDAERQRRQQLAQLMLRQSDAGPAIGWTGALSKMLSGAIAGYQMGMDSREQQARGEAKNATLANALRAGQGQAAETKQYGDGTTINWDERKGDPNMMAAILAGNRDTAPIGMQMQIGQMDERRKNETAAAVALLKRQNDREDEFYKPIKTDDGSIIVPAMQPGFQMPGRPPTQTPAAPAPQAAPQVAPQAGPVATAPPVPLTPTSGSGPMGPNTNNPGNIRTSDGNAWQGKTTQQGSQFESFDTAENGVRAMSVLLGNYAKQGVNTLGGIVGRWAPPNENQTSALVANAAKRTGLDPNQPLDLSDPAVRARVVQALIVQEQGKMPYGQDVVQAGVSASMGGGTQPSDQPGPTDTQPPPVQVSDQASLGRLADASGAIPQSAALAPGVLYRGGAGYRPLTQEERAQYNIPAGQAAQIDRKGNIKTIGKERGDGGSGAMFPGKTNEAAAYNTYRTLQGKLSRGEQLTGDEQFDLQIAQQVLTQPKTVMTDQGLQSVTPPPLPTRNAPQASPAQAASTDAVPNPLQPAAPPAPAPAPAPAPQPNQPTVTTLQPKAAKPIPEGIQKGMLENVNAVRKIDDTLAALAKAPDATGTKVGIANHLLPDSATNFLFPEGTNARALIAEIGSMKIHDRAGASQTASEMENLKPFIPKMSDSPKDIATKLTAFRREYINMLSDQASVHSAENGFQPNPIVTETLKNGHAPAYQAPKSGEDRNKPTTPTTIMRFDAEGNIIQ